MTNGIDAIGGSAADVANAGQPGADRILGLLADPDRRLVLAAVELGAATLAAVVAASGLAEHRAAKALGKLVDGRVVVSGLDGALRVAADVFARAARSALERPRNVEHAAEPGTVRRVLNAFVRDGRIVSIPTSPAKRAVVLDWLARRFEPGRNFPEAAVNEMLDGHAVDAVTLRRYLVDATLLDRRAGVYWRTGGTVDAQRRGEGDLPPFGSPHLWSPGGQQSLPALRTEIVCLGNLPQRRLRRKVRPPTADDQDVPTWFTFPRQSRTSRRRAGRRRR